MDGDVMSDLFVRPSDKHQLLDPNSSYLHYFQIKMAYGQLLRLNKICSDNENCWYIMQRFRRMVNRKKI